MDEISSSPSGRGVDFAELVARGAVAGASVASATAFEQPVASALAAVLVECELVLVAFANDASAPAASDFVAAGPEPVP